MSKTTLKKSVAVLAATAIIATYSFVAPASAQSKEEVKYSLPQQSMIIQKISEKLEQYVQESNYNISIGAWQLIFSDGQLTLQLPKITTQPTAQPTAQPTTQPTAQPTTQPTAKPTAQPTAQPTTQPTAKPTTQPTTQPTAKPTAQPTAQPTTQPTAQPTSQPSDATEVQKQVLSLVNEQRAAAGLKALELDAELNKVATAKAKDMDDNNYFSHTSPTYGSPFDMLKTFGVSYRTAGENIASGQRSAEQVMNDWMNSSGHRANILNSSYTKLGVGYVNGKWVQLFIG